MLPCTVVLIEFIIFLIVNPGIFPQIQLPVFPDWTDLDAETTRRNISLVQRF
jgi:hypothetical protein